VLASAGLDVRFADVGDPDPARASVRRRTSAVGRDELAKALVVLVAGRAALQVCAHARETGVSVLACEFEVDILVEQFEALVAGDLGLCGSEQAADQISVRVLGGHCSPPV
jgi:hypothetical protein